MLGGGGRGVKRIRQGMELNVTWSASSSPFSAAMAMSVEGPEHMDSAGVPKEPVLERVPWKCARRAEIGSDAAYPRQLGAPAPYGGWCLRVCLIAQVQFCFLNKWAKMLRLG